MARKRKQFSIEEKVHMIQQIEAGRKKRDLRKEKNMASSTLSTILKNKEKIMNAFHENVTNTKKLRKCSMEDVDYTLINWFKLQCSQNNEINNFSLQQQATTLARKFGYGEDFQCSTGWITRFKHRYNIRLKKDVPTAGDNDENYEEVEFKVSIKNSPSYNNDCLDEITNSEEDVKFSPCLNDIPTFNEMQESINKIRTYFQHLALPNTKLFEAISYISDILNEQNP